MTGDESRGRVRPRLRVGGGSSSAPGVLGAARPTPSATGDPSPVAGRRRLRQVLRQVPTSVVVVSTTDGPDPVGCTIGSFVSVSLDPPLVAYFAIHSSSTLDAVRRRGSFSVNVLAEDQAHLGERFAGASGDRFRGVRWQRGPSGSPHLDGALVVLDCHVHDVLTVGDHEMILGRVTSAVAKRPGVGPLVFAPGGLRGLSRVHAEGVHGIAHPA